MTTPACASMHWRRLQPAQRRHRINGALRDGPSGHVAAGGADRAAGCWRELSMRQVEVSRLSPMPVTVSSAAEAAPCPAELTPRNASRNYPFAIPNSPMAKGSLQVIVMVRS